MITAVENVGAGVKTSPDELTKTVSASRLNNWLTCRLRFFFHYVLEIKKPRTAALYVGNIVHGILKQWNMARWRKQSMPVEQLKLLFNQLWLTDQQKELIKWAKDEEPGEQSTAWSLLELYFKETPIPPNETPEGVEVPLEADLSTHGLPRLIGIIDLVRAGGRIVDYKTIGQTPAEDKAIHLNELQLSCYSTLYRESTGRNESGRDLHQLVKTKTPKLIVTQQGPMSDRQETRLFKQIESYVEGVGRKDFIPSPGLQCSACRFLPECRLWG